MNHHPDSLLELIRQLVREELRRHQGTTLAVVEATHPHADSGDEDRYACTIRLQDTQLVLNQVPVATHRLGIASIPAVGDLVLVQFLHGDIQRPIITGSLYNDEDLPPVNQDGQWVCQLPLGAEPDSGLQVVANSQDRATLELHIGAALTLTLQDDDPVVNLEVGGSAARLTIESDGTLTIQGNQAIHLETATELSLKANEITLEGQSQVTVKGGVINLN